MLYCVLAVARLIPAAMHAAIVLARLVCIAAIACTALVGLYATPLTIMHVLLGVLVALLARAPVPMCGTGKLYCAQICCSCNIPAACIALAARLALLVARCCCTLAMRAALRASKLVGVAVVLFVSLRMLYPKYGLLVTVLLLALYALHVLLNACTYNTYKLNVRTVNYNY